MKSRTPSIVHVFNPDNFLCRYRAELTVGRDAVRVSDIDSEFDTGVYIRRL